MPVIHVLQQIRQEDDSQTSRIDEKAVKLKWHDDTFLNVEDLLRSTFPSNCFIFLSSTSLKSERRRREISARFQIPSWFWDESYQRSNGSFGGQTISEGDPVIDCQQTWFRFLVKQLEKNVSSADLGYFWHEMGFFTQSTAPNRTTVLCFDVPYSFRHGLQQSLRLSSGKGHDYNRYTLHRFLTSEVINLYDTSVWTIRDVVRDVERNRNSNKQTEPDFPALHELARHAIHSSETLDVAVETVSEMICHHKGPFSEEATPTALERSRLQQTRQLFQFQLQTLKSLKARSHSNQSRLQNEITLAFNMVTQRDSQATVRIGEAARSDSAAMKTVAVLTLTFLPATFVSAIFSTQFFNFTPESPSGQDSWVISSHFWIYWAFSAPLTIVTIILWFVWRRRYTDRGVTYEMYERSGQQQRLP
ncbi:hypothetical protein GJ744_006922 [Endocarpon pusillum]|uniref:Uncharacterized protein n=1 Tax=Endocarpon pusillum TaxID=364733 RepID=A0A8H7ANA9_9EURO|nr:hypothetical protein GJ744_006922 [Endocarpon pusillum]